MRLNRVQAALLSGFLSFAFVPPLARAGSVLVRSERAETLEDGALLIAADTNLLESVRSLARDEVLFSASGSTIRALHGLDGLTEIRARGGWLTVSGSGHSGQFDAGLGAKRSLLRHESLAIAALIDARGEKLMGNQPFYRLHGEVPATVTAGPAEFTATPGAAVGLESGSGSRVGLALSAALDPDPVAPYVEAFWNSRGINSRFTRFHEGPGWGYSAGLVLEPITGVRIPLTLLA